MDRSKVFNKGIYEFTNKIEEYNLESENEIVKCEMALIRKELKEKKIKRKKRRLNAIKMIYINILGYEVDVGFIEIIELLSSNKFLDKQIGYLAFQMLYSNVLESTRMIINTLQHDLDNSNECIVSNALTVISSLANIEIIDSLAPTIIKLCIGFNEDSIKKRAILTLSKLYKIQPNIIIINPNFMKIIENQINYEMDLGLINSIVLLLSEIIKKNPIIVQPFGNKLVNILYNLIHQKINKEIEYHEIVSPWLQISLFKLLSKIKLDSTTNFMFWELIKFTLKYYENLKEKLHSQIHKKYILMALLFEIASIIIKNEQEQYFNYLLPLLIKLIKEKDINIQCLTLDIFILLGENHYKYVCQKYLIDIIKCLESSDITIKRRTIEVLYSLCTKNNIRNIVQHFLLLLKKSENELKEELVIKISLLAELDNKQDDWYIDTILTTLCLGSEFIRLEISDQIIHSIKNNSHSAIQKIIQILLNGFGNELFLQISCIIIGEFPESLKHFENKVALYLINQLPFVNTMTKRLILTCLIKLAKEFDSIKPICYKACQMMLSNIDVEVQQRAYEYINIIKNSNYDIAITHLPEKTSYEQNNNKNESYDTKKDDDQFLNQNISQQIHSYRNVNTKSINITSSNQRNYKGSIFFHSSSTLELEKKVKYIHKKLLTQNEGIIFQDNYIQIGIRINCSSTVETALYFGNIKDQILPVQVNIQTENGLTYIIQNNSFILQPKKQQQILCKFEARQIFLQAPILQFSYLSNNKLNECSLSLPITLLRFAQPLKFPKQIDFLKNCFFKITVQTSLKLLELQKILRLLNFEPLPSSSQLIYTTMIINIPIIVLINTSNSLSKMEISSSQMSMSQIIMGLLSYLLSNNY
ncbi:adaptin n terminal region domain containing protein [Entamoeba nuttalli P19]|uniref:AP-2 complex subunit alpha n=1 Tax=Entamoeba nuttalli (strain P19) TaxID=1076696 RepID=K2GXU7_ENTNP|nr:adaptin n terminal region domain containing protein [Entamoeba nuttalli P19]EKE38612.1 adaptin n terminal region domain containing protein [Entamoeba nuttalli P19]|eukprot:XP_008859054.1 adaptin n terminal region domain containing protein [Entamoeba nuttalli P19]